jgi:hypothetical protein
VAPVSSRVSLTGRARNLDGRAILVGTDGKKTLVALPGGWPKEFAGRLIAVEGELQANPAATGPDDLVILANARARLLE